MCLVFLYQMSSFDKANSLTNEIGNNWIDLKKVLDKHPKKAIEFFHDKKGWQLKICATFL